MGRAGAVADPARPGHRRCPILRSVLPQGNVRPPPGPMHSSTYDDPLDVSHGPLDLRQGDRHKSFSEFCPLTSSPSPGSWRQTPADRRPTRSHSASTHRGDWLVHQQDRPLPASRTPSRRSGPAGSLAPPAAPSTRTPSAPCRSSTASSIDSDSSRSSATISRARTAARRIPTATGLLLLLKNLLVSREPLYGLGEWAARHVPELLGLAPDQLPSLNDDRVGRCLDRLFDADIPSLTLAVVVHAVREFAVELDELHNDSTTITFHGDYETADRRSGPCGAGRGWPITWGHNKDHRPDLKQLLYILTVARDGAVPVQFRVQSGNATDDRLAPRHLGPALQADRPARLPLRRRLQAGHGREHGLHPSARRPVPQRPAPHPRRGRRLPREVLAGPGPMAADPRQVRRRRGAGGSLLDPRAGAHQRRRDIA